MGNALASVFLWVWSNFIGWPRHESRFAGFVRICFYSYIIVQQQSFFNENYDNGWAILLSLFCILQFIIGIFQMGGAHSINGPTDFELNAELERQRRSGELNIVNIDRTFEQEYPGLTWWFRVRDNHMSGLSNSEKAKFFVETGALTEGSVRELEKYKQTKRALQRLDFECRRPHKELVEYMRGVKI